MKFNEIAKHIQVIEKTDTHVYCICGVHRYLVSNRGIIHRLGADGEPERVHCFSNQGYRIRTEYPDKDRYAFRVTLGYTFPEKYKFNEGKLLYTEGHSIKAIQERVLVYQFVACVFHGYTGEDNQLINHLDNNPQNCAPSNLEICSIGENNCHGIIHNRLKKANVLSHKSKLLARGIDMVYNTLSKEERADIPTLYRALSLSGHLV